MNSRKNYLLLLLAVFLSACATQLFAASPEFGKASYYSDKFQGRKTSSGELYDKNLLTCAHKTYKFGTLVRVTRLDNGLSVVARVNDRGPKREGHVVDLSYTAALQIDLIKAGVLQVKVEVVEPEATVAKETPATVAKEKEVTPPTMPDLVGKTSGSKATSKAPATTPTSTKGLTTEDKTPAKPAVLYQVDVKKPAAKGFAVQIGSYSSGQTALAEVEKVQAKWAGKALLKTEDDAAGNTQYKVLIGSYATKKEADAQQKIAIKKGFPKCYVVNLAEN